MTFGVAPQWVRARAHVPPDDRRASTSGANATCTPSKGSTELEGAEDTGRVMEPRNTYRCGQQAISQRGTEGKADSVQWPEGSSPRRALASGRATTGVSERGMYAWGELGNVGEPLASLPHSRNGGPGDQTPWRERGASTRARARTRDTTNRQQQARYRGASDKRSATRGADG
jgi:hypothetical protein